MRSDSPVHQPSRRLLAGACLLGLASLQHAGAATVVVTGTGDAITADGQCTLREAMTSANTNLSVNECLHDGTGTVDTIAFAIPGPPTQVHTIAVGSLLPLQTGPVVIDGLTQPGADCTSWPPALRIEISNPTNFAGGGLLLDPAASGSTIRGLVINGFNNESGDNFRAAIRVFGSDNRIQCNFLGTDATGTTAVPNLRGIDISSMTPGGASRNVIGSDGQPSAFVQRNLISGNRFGQVNTRGNAPADNVIAGNYIGLNAAGTGGLGGGTGVGIGGGNGTATGNIVGYDGVGDPELMRNVIGGLVLSTSGSGVSMVVGASANRVSGNYIGTDATGTVAVPLFIGIELGSNASVSGNLIGWDGTGNIFDEGNLISGNSFAGAMMNGINGTDNNAVVGNRIGVNALGAPLPNGAVGLSLDNSSDTLVARNYIANNPIGIRLFTSGVRPSATFRNGVAPIAGAAPMDSSFNCVVGNGAGISYTLQNGATATPTTFESNWWGAADGPIGAGGSGNSVTGPVDVDPFLTGPTVPCQGDDVFADGFEDS